MIVQAAVAVGPGADFQLTDLNLDDPHPDEVLVRIEAVGLCHTDLVVRDQPMGYPLPAVLGHEGAGVVERVGEAVTKVSPGDRVLISFRSCGHCSQCDAGLPGYCAEFIGLNLSGRRPDGSSAFGPSAPSSNFFGQSSFASHALTYERNLVRLPEGVACTTAAPLACGVQTGAGAILRALDCPPGSSLVIIGGGTVGLSGLLAARLRDCAPIILIDPLAQRRSLALELGASHVLDPFACDVNRAVREIAPRGVDFVLDASGAVAAIETSLGYLAPRGALGLVGAPAQGDAALRVPIALAITFGLRVIGIIEGDSEPETFIPELLGLFAEGRFPFDRLISTYPFEQINQAVADQHAGRVVKVVLTMDAQPDENTDKHRA